MIIESKAHLQSLTGEEYHEALIALHHADDTTLERLNITSADVSLWLDEAGVTPPGKTVVGEPMPAEDYKRYLDHYARELARSKVQAALGLDGDDEVLALSEQLRRSAVAQARAWRVQQGRPESGDKEAVDAVEPMADAIAPIDAALASIRAEINSPADPDNPQYTSTDDIDASAEWP